MRGKRVLFCTLLLEFVFQVCAGCPPGAELRNNECYLMVVSQQATNAYGLRRLCWDRGAELISVETEADVSLIYEYMNLFYGDADRPHRVLLGVTDIEAEGTFVNLDGKAMNFVNWKTGEPDNGNGKGEDCVIIENESGEYDTPTSKWVDVSCCFNDTAVTVAFCKIDDGVSFTEPTIDIIKEKCYGDCPDGWLVQGSSRCYKQIFGESFSQPGVAREACRQYGGDLPVVDSQEALDLALGIMRSSDSNTRPTKLFLGLTALHETGSFKWVNGQPYTQGNPMSLTDTGSKCVTMTSSDSFWLPGNSTITWQTESCCSISSGIRQALCMRPISGDFSLIEQDLIKIECNNVYCPRGAFVFNSNGQTMCYNYFRDTVTFQGAENICSSPDGSSMLVIRDDVEQQAIVTYTGLTNSSSDPGVWIGLSDRTTEGVWQWTDGTVYGFNKFAPSEASGSPGSDCVSMSPAESMLWTSVNCTNRLSFVCARRAMYN